MIHIGRHTYHPADLIVKQWHGEDLRIGSFCSIAEHVIIYAGGQHHTGFASTFPFDECVAGRPPVDRVYKTTKPTIVGHDVWIGARSMIMGGVRVGTGSIIAAGAVVFEKVPPYAVMVGNPAEVHHYRFGRETIDGLLKIAWWNWSDEKIVSHLGWFYKPAAEFVARFLDEVEPQDPRRIT